MTLKDELTVLAYQFYAFLCVLFITLALPFVPFYYWLKEAGR